jgi:predicted transcriptional regulator
MSRTQNLTVRLEEDLIRRIEQEAEYEKTDKSTVVRKMIAFGIDQARRTRALDDYRKEKCTLWKASEKTGISLREMIELLHKERIPIQRFARRR